MHNPGRYHHCYARLIALSLILYSINALPQIVPNAVFKEYTYPETEQFSEIDPESSRLNDPGFQMYGKETQLPKSMNIDLEGAVRAEMAIEFWGGHIGTSEQKFKVNGNEWIYLPQPQNTPEVPNCYYRTLLGNETVEIPLNDLVNGENIFQFTAGPQLCNDFDWGFYWIYTFTVRVYYHDSIAHPTGQIFSHSKSDTIYDNETFTISVNSEEKGIQKIDLIGYYEDFDWEGNGVYEQWHYQLNYGVMKRHMGSSVTSPYRIKWNSEWVPDQGKPIKIMAILRDSSGFNYSTSIVDSLFFIRENRHVKMYRPFNVPTNFGSRTGRVKSCKIAVNDDLANATSARFAISTWSGFTHDDVRHELQINELPFATDIGSYHNYSYDYIELPVSCLKNNFSDTNTFTVYSEYEGHTFEINWPGPVLLIEYIKDSLPRKAAKPLAPKNLQVDLINESLAKLSWEHVNDHLGYVIERKRTSFDYQTLTIIQPNLNRFRDETYFYTADSDTIAYTYRIYAYNCAGNSNYSNETSLYNSDLTAGKKELLKQEITIYPNPANHYIIIRFGNEKYAPFQIKLFDSTGNLVKLVDYSKRFPNFQERIPVNMLEKGIYMMMLIMEGKVVNKKVIIQ